MKHARVLSSPRAISTVNYNTKTPKRLCRRNPDASVALSIATLRKSGFEPEKRKTSLHQKLSEMNIVFNTSLE